MPLAAFPLSFGVSRQPYATGREAAGSSKNLNLWIYVSVIMVLEMVVMVVEVQGVFLFVLWAREAHDKLSFGVSRRRVP